MTRSDRAIRWEPAVAALLLACAVAPLLSRVRSVAAADRGLYCREESDLHIERGDALLHGVPLSGVARAMPFYSVPNAYLCYRLTPAASAAVRSGAYLGGAVLVFALGSFLYSGVCGAAAVLLYALLPLSLIGGERWLYALTVLFTAYGLVRRARSPSLAGSLRLGAAIGASLLVLSPLFLFPLLLILCERAIPREREAGSARVRDAAALCLVPALFLIPWIVMNWRLTGRFVAFEDGRADDNVITGALGFVRTMGIGNSGALATGSGGGSILLWAAGEILRHPLRYAGAFAARLGYAARLQPLLVPASVVSVWIARKREESRQLALLTAYFVGIHCLMPVQESYFVPAWPLLAVLASGLLAPWTRPIADGTRVVFSAAVDAVFAALLAAQACVLGLTWSYPVRSVAPDALERELAADPKDAWLWSARGMGLLRSGRAKEAVPDLARARDLDPQKDREIRYAWALLSADGPDARVWEEYTPASGMLADLRGYVLRTIYLDLAGRRAEALASLDAARAFGRSIGAWPDALPPIVLDTVAFWPAPRRAELIAFFSGVPEFRGAMREDVLTRARLDAARGAIEAGDLRFARADLEFAEKADRRGLGEFREDASDLLLGEAAAAAKSGRRGAAREILALAENDFPLEAGGPPPDPERMKRWVRDYDALGEPERAARISERVRGPSPDDDARRLFLGYQDSGDYSRALALADLRVRALPRDARWRSDRGVLRGLMGQREAAVADWKDAIALDPDLVAPYLSLGSLYVSLNRRKEALELYRKALLRPRIKENADDSRRILAGLSAAAPHEQVK